MMRALSYFFLLPLIGWCSGILEVNLEYQYHYSGRVAAGIPDIQDQYSASGIQFDVTFQVPDPSTVLVQLSNIEVGNFHDELHCDVRAPLPIEYHPLFEGGDLLQTTFKLILNESTVVDMEVPDEPLWVTNIRKSAINIFRITTVKDKMMYGLYEDVIAGYCWNWYTLAHLPDELAAHEEVAIENTIEEDAQRESHSASHTGSKGPRVSKNSKSTGRKSPRKGHSSKTSKTTGAASNIPDIKDTLWTMSRSVDFEECKEVVSLKIGAHTDNIDNLISRASSGVYLLRGDIPHQRIERAVVEGTVSVMTRKNGDKHIDTFTNQTVQLRAVRAIRRELHIDSELHSIHSWHFEADHCITNPRAEADYHHPEEILTGIHLSEENLNSAKDVITHALQNLADYTPFFPSGQVVPVVEMTKIIDAMALLSSADLQELYARYSDEEFGVFEDQHISRKYAFLQALGAVGTGPAIRLFTSKAKESDHSWLFTEKADSMAIFNAMNIVVKHPSSFVTLMETVKAIPWTMNHRIVKSIALMNLGKLAHSHCLTSQNVDVCSEEDTCSAEIVINTFIPYLQEGFEDEESELWQRFIYLQALSNIGSPHTINILKPIILGTSTEVQSFRINAIWSLSSHIMQHTARDMVFDILMPVFTNYAEPHEIRNIAFLVMSTWNPRENWWQHMATLTWNDPSSQVANFISSTISSIAHSHTPMSETLGRLLHKAKPAAVSSLSYSLNSFLHEFIYSTESDFLFTFAWLSSTKNIFPHYLFANLKRQLMHGFEENFEMMIFQSIKQDHIQEVWMKLFGDTHPPIEEGSDHEIVREMWNEIKENLGLDHTGKEGTLLATWYKIQNILQSIIFLNEDRTVLRAVLYPIPIIHQEFGQGFDFDVNLDSTVAIPTELGLPFITKFSSTAVTLFKEDLKVQEVTTLLIERSGRVAVDTKTLVPWSTHFSIGSGIDHVYHESRHAHVQIVPNMAFPQVKFTLEPVFDGQAQIYATHNLPYTYLSGPFPTATSVENNECKVIYRYNPEHYTKNSQWSVMGLHFNQSWTSDFDFPLDWTDQYKLVRDLPFHGAWEYHLFFDKEASTTKSINLSFTYVFTDKSVRVTQEEDNDDFGQYSQSQGGDYDDYSQYPQSASQNYQDILEVETNFGEQQSVSGFGQEQQRDSRQRITKLQQQVSDRGHIQSVGVEVDLIGTHTQNYEAVLTWATGIDASKTSYKIQLALTRNVPQGLLGEPHSTCFDIAVKKPKFLPLMTAEEVLSADLSSHVTAEVYDGMTCSESNTPELSIEGILSLSAEAEADLRRKLGNECGSTAQYLPIDAITEMIYDNAHVTAKWTQEFPHFLKNLTYKAGDALRCLLYHDISLDHSAINSANTLELDATKCLDTNHWTVRTTMPHETAIIHDLETPMWMHVFGTPSTIMDKFTYNVINNHQYSACVISIDHVRTHDGQVYSYEPDECWQNFHVDCSANSQGAMMVRHTGQWEARIMWTSEGLLFDMTNNEFLVNGEEPPEHDDRYELVRFGNAQLLVFNSYQGVKVYEDRVEILLHPLSRTTLCGLCGNYDGEKTFDMVGPKGCVYTDPELYKYAWTVPGDGCGTFAFRGKKRKVEQYQEHCPKISVIPTGILSPEALVDCTEWEYQTKAVGFYTCTAQEPTKVCKPECTTSKSVIIPVEYHCQVIGSSSHYQHTYPTTVSTYCVPN